MLLVFLCLCVNIPCIFSGPGSVCRRRLKASAVGGVKESAFDVNFNSLLPKMS